MIKKISDNFNIFLIFSIIIHIIILILIFKYMNKTKLIIENNQRSTKIEMVHIDKKELSSMRRTHSGSRAKKAMHQGYKNSITSQVDVHDPIKNVASTNTYQITHSKVKPMQVYNKPQSVFENVTLNQSIKSDIASLETDDSAAQMSFVNGNARGVVDSLHDELAGLGININTNVKLQLIINSEGNVLSAEIVTSSGDIDKDSQILSIVNRWKFEHGDLDRQTVIVNLKYFIK